MGRLTAVGMAVVIAAAVGVVADGVAAGASSWSADPFAVEGWMVELAGPTSCTPPKGQVDCTPTKDDMLLLGPCVQRFEHDYPDWTADGCGAQRSFVDGVQRVADSEGEVYEEDHEDGILSPNPWFAPVFDDWQGPTTPVGDLTLYPRELIYGGADVIGLDADGVPVLYVQRNESELERVSVFVRAQTDKGFPTAEEVAAALELAGLPDAEFARALVSERRIAAARRHFDAAGRADGTPHETDSATPRPPPQRSPSQTPEQAARDGVNAEIAALPFDARVDLVDRLHLEPVETLEGVWVLSRMPPMSDCPLSDTGPVADYPCGPEYGEVLLLDHDRTNILRAFPMPEVVPQYLRVTDDPVYCTHQADGVLPLSAVCRIDRGTYDFAVRVFP